MRNEEKGLNFVKRNLAHAKKDYLALVKNPILNNKEEEKTNAVKMFIARALYLIDRYFDQANFNLNNWLDRPEPDAPENVELRMAREKLERKEKRMNKKKYKERFVSVWYKEWDDEKKYPQRQFWSESYEREMDKIWRKIRMAKEKEQAYKQQYISEAIQKELNNLFGDIFYAFEMMKDEDIEDNNPIQYIVQTVAVEHFLSFSKRACSVLEVDIKKNRGWEERSLALGRFILSLKERINKFSNCVNAKTLVALQDIALSAELFIIEINNSVIERRKQELSRGELQETLERGFQQVVERLSSIEEKVRTTNKQIAGVNGRLRDILIINMETLQSSKENGRLIGSFSEKVDEIGDRLSSIENVLIAGITDAG